jgi:aminoglycoside phosphotransferase (APT) family kinase protein
MSDRPDAEWRVDLEVARRVAAGTSAAESVDAVRHVATGWDNAVFRVGERTALRLPRRAAAVPLLRNEQRWLPHLQAELPLPIPTPIQFGESADGFAHPWSLVPWFDGAPLWHISPDARDRVATALAAFLAALHRPAPGDAPVNPVRGVSLAERARAVPPRFDTPEASALEWAWNDGLAAPAWREEPVWLHGDLHPGNLVAGVSADGTAQLSAVVDWGDIGSGDPACDLVVAWFGLEATGRAVLHSELARLGAVDDAMWRRGRGWAAAITDAMLHATSGDGDVARMARFAVRQLAAEA